MEEINFDKILIIMILVFAAIYYIMEALASIGAPVDSTGITRDGSGEDNENPYEFIKPYGLIPNPYDPEKFAEDWNGHQYCRLSGVWYDENWNSLPSYLYDDYGFSSYEKKYVEKDD